ncbi:MAG TPA: type III-B CRISPR module RAMP protein Cmr4 [Streptosporangiaceae bacterium]|nr:type III-B CRISPR module RAMP protein Cmr4 [Streptosporangiaceae bacterium]
MTTTALHRGLLFLYAETPVHAGADTGLGAVDLPIQREITTGLPIIKGESLKGALRERLRTPEVDRARWLKMFGDAPPSLSQPGGTLRPGEIRVHEAQLVAFPVPTLDGFAWVTCPLVRARLHRRASLAKITSLAGDDRAGADDTEAEDDTRCLRTDTRLDGRKTPPSRPIVLGSYAFTSHGDNDFKGWATSLSGAALPELAEHDDFRKRLQRDLYQVSDLAMKALTSECAEVRARVQLGGDDDQNPVKTVRRGPFYSEYLPSESLLVALIESASADHLRLLREQIGDQVLQVGGDETIGKGLMWCRLVGPEDFEAPAAADSNGAA